MLRRVAEKQNVVWTQAEYLRVLRCTTSPESSPALAVEAPLAAQVPSDPSDPLAWSRASQLLAEGSSHRHALWAFCCCLGGLRAGTEDPSTLILRAEELLEARQVRWARSNLRCMRADLHRAIAAHRAQNGRLWSAAWHGLVAHQLDPSHPPPDGWEAACQGFVAKTLQGRTHIPALSNHEAEQLRLAGDVLGCAQQLEEHPRAGQGPAWTRACNEASLQGTIHPFLEFFRTYPDPTDRQRLLGLLFAHAFPERNGLDKLHSAGIHAEGLPLALAFSRTEAKETPLEERILSLGEALEAIDKLDLELLLLALGAAGRFLFRRRRHRLSRLVHNTLGALSRALSPGSDLFRTNLDIARLEPPQPSSSAKQAVVRGAQTLSLLADLGTQLGIARLRRLFRPSARSKRLQEDERNTLVRVLARHARHMKGPLMKVIQHLGYIGFSFDPTTQAKLDQLYDRGPPMHSQVAMGVLQDELGCPIDQVFAQVEPEPLGVGSIGQVHRATLLDGTPVALKIQFPWVRFAIDHDLWMFGLWTPVLHILSPHTDWKAVRNELRAELHREADYRIEATTMEAYRQAYSDLETLRIARTYPELITQNLLVMELAEGQTLQAFAKTATVEQRCMATEALLHLHLRDDGMNAMYADFNLGNFLFTPNEVWCLDFGCVKVWPDEDYRRLRMFSSSVIRRDLPDFREAIRGLGLLVDPQHFDYKRLFDDFSMHTFQRHRDGQPLPFTTEDVARMISNFVWLRPDQVILPFHLYAMRSLFGFMAMIVRLDCLEFGEPISLSLVAPSNDPSSGPNRDT